MRIIYKKTSDLDGGRLGVCACDIISFRHHPADTDPCLLISRADGWTLTITQTGRENGMLDRIVEALLSPGGVADCRKVKGLRFDLKKPPTHVFIDNPWAQTVLTGCGRDGDLVCLATAAVRR